MNFFPIVEGFPKEIKSGITYSLCSNGIFEVRALPGGGFVSTKVEGIKGLPEGKEEIRFLKKRIPMQLFWEVVLFFRSVNDHFKDKLEAYILVGFNEKTQEYFLWVPPHRVSMGSVHYDIEQFYKLPEHEGCYIVLDLHLHPGKMGAFFSGTDNKDDCRDRFSGVVSSVYDAIPDYKFRFAAGNKHIDIQIADLFTNDPSCTYKFDIGEGLSKISLIQRDPLSTSGCVIHNHPANKGFVPGAGRTLFDMLKEKKDKKFTLGELMGSDW